MKLKHFILAASLLTSSVVYSDQITSQGIGPFGGLNTSQAQEALPAQQSPDLLNVDVGNGGTSVKKRQGYGLDVTLNFSTGPVHNLYKFFDSSGNEVRLAFNDVKVNSSVNGAAWSVILTTGVTSGATWDCTDYLGFAYCVSSAFDCPIKTNGTSAGTTGVCGTNGVPQGSLISNTGDRLLVGATSANPSRLYYSQSAVVTNFALGVQPSDSSFEDIVAPGSKLTHLAYRFGRWLWWKDQSFGFIVGTSQFDLQIITVSNTIGTLDNTDVFDGNYVYFRGSDAQIYTYDGSNLSRAISTDIGPTLKTANRRKANFWTQTSQSDFTAGGSNPTGTISLTSIPGAVTTSTNTTTDSSSANFGAGTVFGTGIDTYTVVGALTLHSYLADNFTNFNNWTSENDGVYTTGTMSASGGKMLCSTGACQAVSTQTINGDFVMQYTVASPAGGYNFEVAFLNNSLQGYGVYVTRNGGTSQPIARKYSNFNDHSAGLTLLCTGSTAISSGDVITMTRIAATSTFNIYRNSVLACTTTDSTYTSFTNIRAFYSSNDTQGSFDDIYDTAGKGYFNSQLKDTSYASPVYGTILPSTSATGSYSFSYKCSSSTIGALTAETAYTTDGRITGCDGKRYIIWGTTLTATSSGSSPIQITDLSILSASTGTYYSAVNNAPNLTSFSTIGISDSNTGNSSISYFTRSSTNSFTVLSTTPTWVAQPKNATVTASTGTYMQLRADFSITAASETPTLSDFTFNWFEGSASDKMYGTYFSNAIWFSVSIGTTTSTNNRIFRYDLLSNLWTLYDIASNGFLTYNNNLYFGDPTAGRVFQFGNNVYSDNGTAINAYWKSKPFFGDSPFTEKDMRMGSWYVASDSGTTLTITYTLDESTNTVVKNISLADTRKGMIRNNYNFPAGTAPTVFSAKFGDNSTNPPWEVFGGLLTFVPRPIVVTP